MKTITKDRRRQSQHDQPSARGVNAVATDLDKLLGPKIPEELEKLEKQIQAKLSSNEPVDTDYWEHLLSSLLTYKAKAKLRKVSEQIVQARLAELRKQQAIEAVALMSRLEAGSSESHAVVQSSGEPQNGSTDVDPDPLLRLRQADKLLESKDEAQFAHEVTEARRKVLKRGYIPLTKGATTSRATEERAAKRPRTDGGEDAAQPSTSVFDREVARGLGDNEEIFTAEEPVETKNKSSWAHKYRPRKPKYFNRVQMGYEWNKYNQTHYDHDNPPPKVVQGYKFNIFYPDLVDKTRAPTYRIEREHGRKRGETFAPAGEDDTCLIRFIAGPPYDDIAFRIVDREWDYSAKRERGFRSSFDKVCPHNVPPLQYPYCTTRAPHLNAFTIHYKTNRRVGNSPTSFSIQEGIVLPCFSSCQKTPADHGTTGLLSEVTYIASEPITPNCRAWHYRRSRAQSFEGKACLGQVQLRSLPAFGATSGVSRGSIQCLSSGSSRHLSGGSQQLRVLHIG